jgi:adenylosuccinate synthase
MKKADMIIDLQFGSTGKGLIAGYLANNGNYDVVINANMPNAGHTFINSMGRKMVHKVLPNGLVSHTVKKVMLGPGSVFSLDRLIEELTSVNDLMSGKELLIHPDAMVLQPCHAAIERNTLSGIASTMQGSAAAMIDKIMRQKDATTARNTMKTSEVLMDAVCTHQEWAQALREAENILIEGAQGYSLGINAGFYPYCTSRDCTPARFLADCGIPHTFLRKVIGTARVHPIRVGDTPDGTSGGMYPDQRETSWEAIGRPPETTTVTGRVRRVFTFSLQQIMEASFMCQPDEIFLNFCNYNEDLAADVIEAIESHITAPVRYTGHGPSELDVVDHEGQIISASGVWSPEC